MLVFQSSFLSGLHRVAVKYAGSPCTVRSSFQGIRSTKFRSAICKQDMDILSEKLCSKDRFEKVNPFLHGLCCFCFMVDAKEDTGVYKLEGLDKGTIRFIIIDRVHLCDKNIWIFRYVLSVIFVGASLKIFAVAPFFVSLGSFFGNPA